MPKKPDADTLEWFRQQGRRGGKARASKLTPAERSAIAKKAAAARWKKKPKDDD